MPSENGWEPARAAPDQCQWVTVPGTNVSLQLLKGQPLQILRAFAADFNAYVEPLRDADSAAWTPTNAVPTSNHLNGTAMDLNWNGADGRTFRLGISEQRAYPPPKDQAVRDLLAFYEDTVFCGGHWNIRDWMHFNMGYNTFRNPRTQDFIDRKIRPDGLSTFRRGGTPPPPPPGADPVRVLADAMGNNTGVNYAAKLAAVRECLRDCDCVTVERIAMWCAQIGHESGGLFYMEEIASGDAYEGRQDLGNTQPGDGRRFKGRGPLQITGRHNYTALSQWAYERRLVPTSNFFVEHPEELATDENGFIGVTWYWTTQRPMNAAADAKDIARATRYVNGGLNGLQDRTARYNRCLGMGEQLLTLVGIEDWMALSDDEQRELLDKTRQLWGSLFNEVQSKSRYADERGWPTKDFIRNTDGHVFDLIVEHNAALGDEWSLDAVRSAAASGDRIAQAFLDRLNTPPDQPTPAPSAAVEPVRQVYEPQQEPRELRPVSAPLQPGGMKGLASAVDDFAAYLQQLQTTLRQLLG